MIWMDDSNSLVYKGLPLNFWYLLDEDKVISFRFVFFFNFSSVVLYVACQFKYKRSYSNLWVVLLDCEFCLKK